MTRSEKYPVDSVETPFYATTTYSASTAGEPEMVLSWDSRIPAGIESFRMSDFPRIVDTSEGYAYGVDIRGGRMPERSDEDWSEMFADLPFDSLTMEGHDTEHRAQFARAIRAELIGEVKAWLSTEADKLFKGSKHYAYLRDPDLDKSEALEGVAEEIDEVFRP